MHSTARKIAVPGNIAQCGAMSRYSLLSNAISTTEDYWWLTVFPGLAIFLTVLAINFVGDGLRDALDPRRVL